MPLTPGTVVLPGESIDSQDVSRVTLRQENSYTGIVFTLGPDWSAFLDGSYQIYFTMKARYTDETGDELIDKLCSVKDQSLGEVELDLDPTDTDIPVIRNAWYQIQIRKADLSEVKTPLTGVITVRPTLKDV